MTNERVVSYEAMGKMRYFASATFNDIADIEVTYSESWVDYTEVIVTTIDGEAVILSLSAEGGGDRTFLERLHSEWDHSKTYEADAPSQRDSRDRTESQIDE